MIELINLHIVIIAIIAAMLVMVADGQRRGDCCQDYCYYMDNERPQSAHFASKTSYLIAKGPETGKQYLVPSKLVCATYFNNYSKHSMNLKQNKPFQIVVRLKYGSMQDMVLVYQKVCQF